MNKHTQDPHPQPKDHDPLLPPGGDGVPTDAGAYIGHEPELARETIPGGVQRADVRVAGVATQPTGTGVTARAAQEASDTPSGHRQGPQAADDTAREAGEDR